MNFKSTLILSSLIALSLTSCSVYYTTSEVDSSLLSTVSQVNVATKKLDEQVSIMVNEYHEIHCDQKSPEFIQADQML